MLTLHQIRTETDYVKERLKIKHFKEIEIVDTILQLDEEKRKQQIKSEELLAKINNASKEIGKLMAEKNITKAEELKNDIATYKNVSKELQDSLNVLEQQLHDELVKLPNLPHVSVPEGKTPEENAIVKQSADIHDMPQDALCHWDICAKYQLIDFELGTKITGAGFPVYIDKGAKLQRALIQYFLDYNTAAGYKEYMPPHVVNTASAYGTGQLPDKEGQMYHVGIDNLYMIPTAEVPITNLYRDNILKENELPVKMTAYTPCFRREAGSYGKDVRGLNRLHQFDKVEIVRFSTPQLSYAALDEMVLHVENLIISLGLPYRILRLCGGDMSFASALTYDFEVYSAAQKKWLEVSSVSNFETFQTNRMKIRYKDENGKSQLLHSLNGSSLALPRIVAALLENNQQEDGIHIPTTLIPYTGFSIIQ